MAQQKTNNVEEAIFTVMQTLSKQKSRPSDYFFWLSLNLRSGQYFHRRAFGLLHLQVYVGGGNACYRKVVKIRDRDDAEVASIFFRFCREADIYCAIAGSPRRYMVLGYIRQNAWQSATSYSLQ